MKFDYIPSKIYVDQQAIYDNFKAIQKMHPTKKILAVVKANAYGHGVTNVCFPALKAGAAGFCVAYVDEGCEIRSLGIDNFILVLGASEPRAASTAQKEQISLTAPSIDWLKEVVNYLDPNCSNKLKVHLGLDTGMGRIGITTVEELEEETKFILAHEDVMELEGVFTHFATADENNDYYRQQKSKFKSIIESYKYPVKYVHCENTAASLIESDDDHFTTTIRLGIGLYGASPFAREVDLKPALSLKSQISFVKKVSKGTRISYGATYTAPEDEYIATVSIGYADGWLRRMQGFHLLVNGDLCENVGRITMDQLMIKIPSPYPIGTEVTLIGSEGSSQIKVEEVAAYAETIPYEILTTLSKRVPRIAINKV